jgi:hypothetical protein
MTCYRCGASYWELAWTRTDARGRATDVMQCVFCGVLELRPVFLRPATGAGSMQTSEEQADRVESVFVFDSGRFAGKTIAEVIAHPSGRQYLDWARVNVQRWTRPIEQFLNHAAPSA